MAKKAAKGTAAEAGGKSSSGTRKVSAAAPGKPASPMINEVRELIDLMVANGLNEVALREGTKRITLRRGMGAPMLPMAVAPQAAATQVHAALPAGHAASASAAPAAPSAPAEKLLDIKSPMVGTFYAAPSPDSDPYVSTGMKISDDSVVCIIEAMKVMNEIKAECSGTVVEICVKNAQPVEFGQVLFRVRPQ